MIIYTGWFVRNTPILKKYITLEKVVNRPHITKSFRPSNIDINIGELKVVHTIGIIRDEKGECLLLDTNDFPGIKYPHITLATRKDTNPLYCKDLAKLSLEIDDFKKLNLPIDLIGGYFDGDKTITKNDSLGDLNIESPEFKPDNNEKWQNSNLKSKLWDRYNQAEDFLTEKFGEFGIASVTTQDGREIFFTRTGKKEFLSSFKAAFLIDGIKSAASQKLGKRPDLANELLSTVAVLDKIVANSSLAYEEPNYKKDKKSSINNYEIFVCPIIINGKQRKVMIKVSFETVTSKEGNQYDKHKYYYHWLTEQQKCFVPVISSFSFVDE